MADEHVPAPSPQSSSGFSASPSLSENTNGVFPPPSGPTSSGNRGASSASGKEAVHRDLASLGRWFLGLLLVFACGWGLLGLIFYLARSHLHNIEIVFGVAAVLDLSLFLFLEKNFQLSRFMGLRIEPGSHFWQSALMLWLFGVVGLLFRSTDFHAVEASAAPRTPDPARPARQPIQRGDSIREIVETIVFVVVLVLLLKSFAAEAFVIPTGSMAQTLLGYQKEVTCPDCGIKFPVNCSQEVDPPDGGKPSAIYACVCPNCLQRIHFSTAPELFLRDNPTSMLINDPGWNSGDRVLVAKFVYDLFNKSPDRLDVVVFKYPGDQGSFPGGSGPHKYHVPMNYIKRLIGLSGETIAIRGGKLYYLSADKGLHYDDYDNAKNDPALMATLWQKNHMHVNDEEAKKRFDKGQFQIIRKSPENILSMMRLVYDNDHPSKNNPATAERWRGEDKAWTAQPSQGFRFDGGDAEQPHWLRYQHLSRDDNGKPSLITDIMGYNTYQGGQHSAPLLGKNWVGDLILECEATIESPQGELALELARGVDRFRAKWDLASGTCTLFRVTEAGEQKLDSHATAMNKKGDYRLRFANVDQRLVVWVNGDLPFDNGVTYQPPKNIGPVADNDLERPARIGAKGTTLAVHKMKLFRDTYYTVGSDGHAPNEADVLDVTFTNPSSWGQMSTPPLLTLYVQPDHFLCLGDNSPESSDGRSWGAVPKRLLLGRALLVYYPFGRAGRIR